jgi:hypothetical protein
VSGAFDVETNIVQVGQGGAFATRTLRIDSRNRYDEAQHALALIRALAPTDGDEAQARDAAVAHVLTALTALDQDEFASAEEMLLAASEQLAAIDGISVHEARVAVGELLRIAAYRRWQAAGE